MKEIIFKGNSLESIRNFPLEARREAGFQLDRVQNGLEPLNWKPLNTIGLGVKEIRIRDTSGIYRVIYVAKFADAVFVLNAFQKKQQKTPQSEIAVARKLYLEIKNA
jgi:phage-related protein